MYLFIWSQKGLAVILKCQLYSRHFDFICEILFKPFSWHFNFLLSFLPLTPGPYTLNSSIGILCKSTPTTTRCKQKVVVQSMTSITPNSIRYFSWYKLFSSTCPTILRKRQHYWAVSRSVVNPEILSVTPLAASHTTSVVFFFFIIHCLISGFFGVWSGSNVFHS